MLLTRARLFGVGPLEAITVPFADEAAPRKMIVVVGGGGVGKTSLLAAIASTRPGYAVVQPRRGAPEPPAVVTEWLLGEDDPARPHALRVASPNVVVEEPDQEAILRRREQALYDRKAQEGGFALVAISGRRWFSRSPVMLSTPERTVSRYDARAPATFDDATRADLARETKQTLVYAAIAAALARGAPFDERPERAAAEGFDRALRDAVAPLARLGGYRFVGPDPLTLEPLFAPLSGGGLVPFDDLPTAVRHLVSFAVLPVRVLAAAFPSRDARTAEGVVLIDDVELHQDPPVQRALAAALREALPRVQWIATTGSTDIAMGCDASEVLALRRMAASQRVELYEGEAARVH